VKRNDTHAGAWLEVLQPRAKYFVRRSLIHGTGHVARVMIHAWIIGQRHRPAIIPELTAAAFIHDLSRRHDDACEEHGILAVQEQLPKWRATLQSIGAKDFDLISTMVSRHCLPQAKDDSLEVRLFRNADGLDRVRLGDLDPTMLFDSSQKLLHIAWKLYEARTDKLGKLLELVPPQLLVPPQTNSQQPQAPQL
jgi:hypothetical protein